MKYVLITPAHNEESVYRENARFDGGADVVA